MAYAYYGFDSDPESFALGFRIDPLLAAVNLLWGAAGTYIGFFRPRYALPFVLACAAFYTALAALGSFTPYHLGMRLDGRVSSLPLADRVCRPGRSGSMRSGARGAEADAVLIAAAAPPRRAACPSA